MTSGGLMEMLEFVPEEARGEAVEFLRGERREFSKELAERALDQGATAFQGEVLRAIAKIPYGETATYGEIAAMIGRPLAVRAVGSACGKNAWPIIIPCHRVVGVNGIGGYGYIGVEMKRMLLRAEGIIID